MMNIPTNLPPEEEKLYHLFARSCHAAHAIMGEFPFAAYDRNELFGIVFPLVIKEMKKSLRGYRNTTPDYSDKDPSQEQETISGGRDHEKPGTADFKPGPSEATGAEEKADTLCAERRAEPDG